MDTPELIKEDINTDWHKSFKVSVPDTITMAQLVRWVGPGFIPLPKENELMIHDRPVFEIGRSSLRTATPSTDPQEEVRELYALGYEKVFESLRNGGLKAKCKMPNGGLVEFMSDFWNQDWIAVYWNDSSVQFGYKVEFENGMPSLIDCNDGSTLFSEMAELYGTDTYSEIIFNTSQAAKIFKLKDDVVRRDHGEKQAKNPKGAGAKPKSDMLHPTIALYIKEHGFEESNSKMAVEIYGLHSEMWGEANTPDTETIRTEYMHLYRKCFEKRKSSGND